MKFEVEISDSQYIKLSKRSELLGSSVEDVVKLVLSPIIDTTDQEFVEYLEEIESMDDDEEWDDDDEEWDDDDEEWDDDDDEEDDEIPKKKK